MAKSKFVDTAAIIQVIGTVFKNPALLSDERYFFNEQDFPEKFHKILFGSIFNLHQLGAEYVTIDTIEDYLEQRPNSFAIYKTNKGREYLQEISDKNISSAFEYYYNRVKKMSLFRAYDELGLDLTWIYDINNIFDSKKKQQQEDFIDNHTLEQLAELINNKVTDIRLKYVDNATEVATQAGKGLDQLINRLETEPAVGYPLFGPLINSITRGARLGKLYLRSAPTGLGKAIPNSTIIPTPTGDKRVDQIKINEFLFDKEGKPTKVLGVYPQLSKKQVYEVYLSDGRKAECCEEHLWTVLYGKRKTRKTLELKDIYNECLEKGYQYQNRQYRFYLPLNQAVEYPEKKFLCPPYVMGAFLGDGHLVESPTNHIVLFSSADEELIKNLEKELGAFGIKRAGNNYNWIFRKDKNDKKTGIWTKELFQEYPELINANSHNKFIPMDYLTSSFAQRLDLLNGLLDTDGSVDKTGRRITYTSVSEQLIKDVKTLCRSLGILVSESHIEKIYELQIRPKKEIRDQLFRLTRKRQRILNNLTNFRSNDNVGIVKIVPTSRFEEMTCFMVDNSEHLFLMNDFIVTHNTRTMIADICNFACNEIYINGKWQPNGTKEPTLYITTEQELEEIQTMMLAFVSEVDEDHILKGEYLEGEKERVIKASNIIANSPLYITLLPNFNLKDIENTIKKNVREYGIKYVAHDYIHSSMAILSEISSRAGVKGLREDNILFMISTRLKDLCNEFGIFIISSTQLNGEVRDAKVFDQNLLRGSKAIADWTKFKL